MYAYDEIYLDDAMTALGEAVDYAANECGIPPDSFLGLFVASPYADQFARGSSRLMSGTTGIELACLVISDRDRDAMLPPPAKKYTISPEYWMGWILAFYQWRLGCDFKSILRAISPGEILQRYPVLHEASEEKCVDCFNSIILGKKLPSRLQTQRKIMNITQKELAERAGVNLRTLQQYESRMKKLSKASVSTVMSLASALKCSINDILDVSDFFE